MKERMNKGSDEKREEAMVYELKKIASLQKLTEQGPRVVPSPRKRRWTPTLATWMTLT